MTLRSLRVPVLLFLFCAGFLSAEEALPSLNIEQVTSEAAFSPRDTAEGVVFQDAMWLSNGYYHGNVLTRDLWRSEDGLVWNRVLEETPYDGYSELVVFQDRLWAVKGSVWNSADGLHWNRVLETTPFGARGYGEVVVHGDRMWQLGSGADVWSSTDGISWTSHTLAAPYGDRAAANVLAHQGKLWLLGGYTAEANNPPEEGYEQYTTHNDVWCSEDGAEWERVLEHAPWSPRMWMGVSNYKGKMWVIGGYDNAHACNLGDIWWSSDGRTWDEVETPESFLPRHEPTCYEYRDSLWVVAGNAWPVLNDVWRVSAP